MTTLQLRESIGLECVRGCLLIVVALACFGLSPTVQAVLPSPTPDGGYPGNNTAEGTNALFNLTSGISNTAVGFRALFKDSSGGNNTATGTQALYSNTTGTQNTANGYVALASNTTGASNTAIGSGALHGNTTASHNTATGYISLYNNTTGTFNVADGDRALYTNSTGNQNTATGYQALQSNTTGSFNTASGYQALYRNIVGDYNTALGADAGTDPGIGSNNIYVGDSGFSGDANVIAIGSIAASGTPYDNCFIGGIAAQTQVTDGATVCEVSVRLADGRLGIDCTHPSNPGSAHDSTPLLRRGSQQPHARPAIPNGTVGQVEKLQATVAQQQKQIEALTAQLKEQAAQIQKVTTQLELRKPATETVADNQ